MLRRPVSGSRGGDVPGNLSEGSVKSRCRAFLSSPWARVAGPLTLFCILLAAGWLFVSFMTDYGEGYERIHLINRIMSVSAALPPSDLAGLRGDKRDEGTAAHERIRERLRSIKMLNPDARFLYLMAYKDGRVIFLADGEPRNSRDYSAPGDVYKEASPQLIDSFRSGKPLVEGPLQDRWGNWVSGLAPLVETGTGRVVAMIGMDIDARRWNQGMRTYRLFAMAVAGLISLLVLFFYAAMLYMNRSRSRISGLNRDLRDELAQRVQTEKALRESETKYRLLFESMLNGFAYHHIITDDGGCPVDYVFLEVNEAFLQMTGLVREDIVGKRVTEVLPGITQSDFNWIEVYGRVASQGETLCFEQYSRELNRWYSVLAYSAGAGYFSTVFDDITQRKKLEDELRHLSLTDELTGLLNRRGFMTLAEHELRSVKRKGCKASLLYIDLDNLKQINDSFGHDEGDRLLIEAAEIFRMCCRSTDLIARIGGDEFVIFPVDGEDNARALLERLEKLITRHNEGTGERCSDLSMSVGIALYDPQENPSLEEMLLRGDSEMYLQKRQRKGKRAGDGPVDKARLS